jgi:hypothetical protein
MKARGSRRSRLFTLNSTSCNSRIDIPHTLNGALSARNLIALPLAENDPKRHLPESVD